MKTITLTQAQERFLRMAERVKETLERHGELWQQYDCAAFRKEYQALRMLLARYHLHYNTHKKDPGTMDKETLRRQAIKLTLGLAEHASLHAPAPETRKLFRQLYVLNRETVELFDQLQLSQPPARPDADKLLLKRMQHIAGLLLAIPAAEWHAYDITAHDMDALKNVLQLFERAAVQPESAVGKDAGSRPDPGLLLRDLRLTLDRLDHAVYGLPNEALKREYFSARSV